jgi:cellulose synthase/poly-beta-1,6-N-acetylglucosamine synthase-like glycosyltransferase
MTYLILLISLGYLFCVLGLALEGFTYKTRPHRLSPEKNDRIHHFSVIINYRNEAHHLPVLLESIAKQTYDLRLVEFIFINDHSTDDGEELIRSFKNQHTELDIKLINRSIKSVSAKKDGITQAVAIAAYEYVICTDADVHLPPSWLQAFHEHYQSFPDQHFTAGPVQIASGSSLLTKIQHHEMVALQMATIGGFAIRQPFMCNGANMSFTKSAFHEVNGYAGNDHMASGDDVFLLEKLAAEDILKCSFLKDQEAIVTTYPKLNWKDMITQRARWAQKTGKTKSLLNILVSFHVMVMNMLLIISPLLWLLSIIDIKMLLLILLSKLITDVLVLVVGHRFFQDPSWARSLPLQLILYPVVIIAIAVASLRNIKWSDRDINPQV